jgi:hypothetical protein
MMRQAIGCAAIVAAVAFVPGLISSLLAAGVPLPGRVMIALMPAGLAFVVALLLLSRDYLRRKRTFRRVRVRLMARDNIGDDEFLRRFPNSDLTLVQQTRAAIARFFGVPVEKIRATDRLRDDFEFTVLEPWLLFFVLDHVVNARNVQRKPSTRFTFRTGKTDDFGDFVAEIQRVLDGLGDPMP